MPIAVLIGILLVWIFYSLLQGCKKEKPVIKDKENLLRNFVGKSQDECCTILRTYEE